MGEAGQVDLVNTYCSEDDCGSFSQIVCQTCFLPLCRPCSKGGRKGTHVCPPEVVSSQEPLKPVAPCFFTSQVHSAPIRVYLLGGRDNRGRTMVNVECLSVWEQTWTKCPDLLEARGSHAAECANGRLFCIAGGGRHSNLDTVESWNPLEEGGNWTLEEAKIKEPRHALSCAAVGKELFVVGGWKYGKEAAQMVESWSGSGDWKLQPSLNQPRRLHAVCSLGDCVFVFGGAGEGFNLLDSAERYHMGSERWERIRPLPFPSYASACAIGDFIFVLLSGARVFRYDPSSDSYEPRSALPIPDWFGFTACAAPPFVFAFGGTSCGRVTPAAFCYDASTDLWHRMPDMPTRRRRSIAVTYHP